MRMVAKDEADIMNADPEELYLAGRLYNLEPFAMEEYKGSMYPWELYRLQTSSFSYLSMEHI